MSLIMLGKSEINVPTTLGSARLASATDLWFQNTLLIISIAVKIKGFCLFLARQPPSGPGPPHSRGFLHNTQRRTTVGRTLLDE